MNEWCALNSAPDNMHVGRYPETGQAMLLPTCGTEIKINSLEKTIELTQHVFCATKKP